MYAFFLKHIKKQIDIATTLIKLIKNVNTCTYKAMSYTVYTIVSITLYYTL